MNMVYLLVYGPTIQMESRYSLALYKITRAGEDYNYQNATSYLTLHFIIKSTTTFLLEGEDSERKD